MGKVYSEIDGAMRAFVERQHVFFVATAPNDPSGHVNCSPKGLDSLRILGPTTIAYVDYTGSGAETIAHVRENGRIVIMLCAFEGAPKIVRFHGRGEIIEPSDTRFRSLLDAFATPILGLRSIVLIDVERISDSCGYGVPLMTFERERAQLAAWAERKGEDGLATYRRAKNSRSIDDLPALRFSESE
jgi:hypothetical protein